MPIREPALYVELLIPVNDDVDVTVAPDTLSHELLNRIAAGESPQERSASEQLRQFLDGQRLPVAKRNLGSGHTVRILRTNGVR